MRPDLIVVPSPLLDEHLGLVQRRELFSRQQLVAQLGVEALAVAVLPRAARLDEECLDVDPAEPSRTFGAANRLSDRICPGDVRYE
jgi:hypothetical protein